MHMPVLVSHSGVQGPSVWMVLGRYWLLKKCVRLIAVSPLLIPLVLSLSAPESSVHMESC